MKFKSILSILNEDVVPTEKHGYACVYFLIKEDKIIYIGQTEDLSTRLKQHKGKDYDRFNYIEVDSKYSDIVESAYIHLVRPELNGSAKRGKSKFGTTEKHAPIGSERLVEMLVDYKRMSDVFDEMKVVLKKGYYW